MPKEISAYMALHMTNYSEAEDSTLRPSDPVQLDYETDGSGPVRTPAELYSVSTGLSGEVGEPKRTLNPPRQRGLVIGIGHSGKIVVAFPTGTENMNGYHYECAAFVTDELGADLKVMLHGHIGLDSASRSTDGLRAVNTGQRVITINKMSDAEQQNMVGSRIHAAELGSLNPEVYINNAVAQTLMSTLGAHFLRIRQGPTSASLYGVSKPH